MQNRTVFVLGIVMIAAGALFIVGNLLQFDPWQLFWPLALIGLGVWFLVRPRGPATNFHFIGDIKRGGTWQVTNDEFTTFVSDINLDLTQAQIPAGETVLICSGFVGDVTLIAPAGLGVRVTATAFVTELNFFGSKMTTFLNPITQSTPEYDSAERKISLQTRYFVGDVKIKAG